MKLLAAIKIANRFINLLAHSCEKIQIAGSIRREKSDVGDIEIVAVPKMADVPTGNLFGDMMKGSLLDIAIEDAIFRNEFYFDTILPKNGDRPKRFICDKVAVDLFIASPDNFGDILFIRTGDADFSRLAVTERKSGGLMPSWLKHKNGRLWNGNNQVVCATEEDFFAAIGIQFVKPKIRCAQTAFQIKKEMASQW